MTLSGITVIDLTRVLSGPYCTMLLGDQGARVVKVERPGRGDDTRAWGPPFTGGESTYFLSINRNKQSVTVDFQHPEGRRILEQLVARADVVVENFRPGTLSAYGLDHATVCARHPGLIYCSISGYGQDGPRRDLAGYDAVVQAEGGLMSITGEPDGRPFRLGLPIADMVAGLFAGQAITAALFERTRSGRGRYIDISMLDSVAALLTYQASAHFASGAVPGRFGNGHLSIVPYDTFATRDGECMLAVGNDDQWQRLCAATGRDDLARDPRFATNPLRVAHRADLQPLLDALFASRDTAEWTRLLGAAGVPCGAVRSIADALADPQLDARGMIAAMTHPAAGPIRLVASPLGRGGTATAPPTLGADTDAILTGELGYSTAAVAALREEGIV